jgi:hypothetical protein
MNFHGLAGFPEYDPLLKRVEIEGATETYELLRNFGSKKILLEIGRFFTGPGLSVSCIISDRLVEK